MLPQVKYIDRNVVVLKSPAMDMKRLETQIKQAFPLAIKQVLGKEVTICSFPGIRSIRFEMEFNDHGQPYESEILFTINSDASQWSSGMVLPTMEADLFLLCPQDAAEQERLQQLIQQSPTQNKVPFVVVSSEQKLEQVFSDAILTLVKGQVALHASPQPSFANSVGVTHWAATNGSGSEKHSPVSVSTPVNGAGLSV